MCTILFARWISNAAARFSGTSQKSVVDRQHVSLNLDAATARSGCSGVLRRGHFRIPLAPNLTKNS